MDPDENDDDGDSESGMVHFLNHLLQHVDDDEERKWKRMKMI